ncbi:MAG: hypothetical protein MUC97_11770 [Bernardetiaceae bacterium]|nr:hypothetical protein [Bernardetiaceae bacterium]
MAPLVNEALYQVADHTIFRVLPIERLFAKYEPVAVKYFAVFIAVRLAQMLLTFYLCWLYYRQLNLSPVLIGCGFLYISLAMGNGVYHSDLSFNTYYDVIFYLIGGLLILRKASPYWFVPLAALAAFNRETSILIPLMLLWHLVDWGKPPFRLGVIKTLKLEIALPLALASLAFAAVFFAIRAYYGQPPNDPSVVSFNNDWFKPGWAMLFRNTLHPFAQNEVWGVVTFLPLLALLYFKRTSQFLRYLFVLILTFWLPVHFWMVTVKEARVFLVPTVLALLPMCLQLLEQMLKNEWMQQLVSPTSQAVADPKPGRQSANPLAGE